MQEVYTLHFFGTITPNNDMEAKEICLDQYHNALDPFAFNNVAYRI